MSSSWCSVSAKLLEHVPALVQGSRLVTKCSTSLLAQQSGMGSSSGTSVAAIDELVELIYTQPDETVRLVVIVDE